ncbi:hypothetical protein LOTGIDRAFT_169888 [Lottia gigantea]|uniref:Uncharacterized protein n=1 Tax=Lottia gigantea TaxID=225164 RepID=V3YWY5_LOTGI|nr:hypothetical protein LOTGIDRAFT_169888 [Lottia gigantea]ESO82568.1 hypothetical protein LOTGIDRAFT_169888 [Lottia gigantea]
MDSTNCVICTGVIKEGEKRATLGDRGACTINEFAVKRKGGIQVSGGMTVHERCRIDFCNRQQMERVQKCVDLEQDCPRPPKRRSQGVFDFQNQCFLCTTSIDTKTKKDQLCLVRSFHSRG